MKNIMRNIETLLVFGNESAEIDGQVEEADKPEADQHNDQDDDGEDGEEEEDEEEDEEEKLVKVFVIQEI